LDRRQPFYERRTNVEEVGLVQEEDSELEEAEVEVDLVEAVEVVAAAEVLAVVRVDFRLLYSCSCCF
jgi:hypothetical protein